MTLSDLQKYYSTNNLGQFKTYQDPANLGGSNYLYIPGVGSATGGYFKVDQPSLSQLDQTKLINAGSTLIDKGGGVTQAAFNDPLMGSITNGTHSLLDNYYNQAQSQLSQNQEQTRVNNLNAAIKSGDTATVEQLQPGYTLWNGAFVQKSQVPILQSNGSTVQGGNVVGPEIKQIPGVGTLTTTQKNPTPTTPQTSATYTPPQATNANNTVYKDANNNVFKMDGTPIDQATFQKMGLNIDHINTKDVLASQQGLYDRTGTGSVNGAGLAGNYSPGGVSELPGASTGVSTSLNDIVSQIMNLSTPGTEEKGLQTSLANAKNALAQFDAETLAQQIALTGQGRGATLSEVSGNQAKDARTAAIKRLSLSNDVTNLIDQLAAAKNDRQTQLDVLKTAYTVTNDNIDRQIQLYELTQPENIYTDSTNGAVYFRNPATGEVTKTDLPGFEAKKPASVEEYNYLKDNGLIPKDMTYIGYEQYKATQYGTEKSTNGVKVGDYSSAFVPGATYNGRQVIGTDGYIDPVVFKEALADATSNGISRADFIKQYGYLLNSKSDKTLAEYGLTPQELKLITG